MNRALFVAVMLAFSQPAYAYLDPATGGALFSIISVAVTSALFTARSAYYKIVHLIIKRDSVDKLPPRAHCGLVLYSEGARYFRDFAPLIDELERRGIDFIYLSSDPKDPALNRGLATNKYYIGDGYTGYHYLNSISADMLVMTTPGLDVLQIKRSPYVKHYAHFVHGPTDMGIYKTYSFDYFDSILINGPHQERSIRALESKRKTAPKELFYTGCIYFDYLSSLAPSVAAPSRWKPTALMAPTWGKNGLLSRYGTKIVDELLEHGFDVIIRPHPQSFVSEKELMTRLYDAYHQDARVFVDDSANALQSINKSDVLISDISGFIFDYLFIGEKPAVVFANNIDKRGLEAADLPHEVWELAVLPDLAMVIDDAAADDIVGIVNRAIAKREVSIDLIRQCREQFVVNYGAAAEHAVDVIVRKLALL